MSQSIPSVTILFRETGHLTKNYARGPGFAHTNCPGGAEFDRGWEVGKIQHTGLIPTQNRFFRIHTKYETELALSFIKQ